MDKLRKIYHRYGNLNNAVLVVALFITVSWLAGTINAIQRNFELQQQVDDLKQEIALNELENQTLEFEQKYYTSAEYQELQAREHFNKASPGEKLINLPRTTATTPEDTTASDTVNLRERSNFAQWMYFLFGQKSG